MIYVRKRGCHLAVRSSLMLISCKSHELRRANRFSPCHYGASPSSMPSCSPRCIGAAVFPMQDPSFHFVQSFATVAGTILVQALDPAKMCVQLEKAMEEHRYSDIWKLYEQYSGVDEFPRKFIVNKLLRICGESLEGEWLEKAYGWVERALEEGRQNQLEYDTLLYLSLSLARGGFHVQASTIVRKLVELQQYPPVTAWSAILAHMSSSPAGSYLAAELILEIGYLFQDNRIDPRKKSNAPLIAMKPNTTAVNIALAGCLLSGTTKKAEQLLYMIPRIGVKADVNLLITMAHIYERNGRKDELRKLQRYIHDAHNLTDTQFRQFYNCLLLCHLKFGDLNSASSMVLEMLRKAKDARNSLASATIEMAVNGKMTSPGLSSEPGPLSKHGNDSEKNDLMEIPVVSFQDFIQDRNHTKLEAEARNKLDQMLEKLQSHVEMITTKRGILQPTERIFVRLVKDFLEAGKPKDLAEFLIKAEKEDSPVSVDSSALVHVINACISLGWLDQAHDLVDEMQLAGIRPSSSVYSSLLKAYCKANKGANITCLLREVRKAGIQLDSSSYEALLESRILKDDKAGALSLFKEMKEYKIARTNQEFKSVVQGEDADAGLMGKLLHEIKEGQKVDYGVHDWNNVIHFFCRKRLMGDAEKALKKMRTLGLSPNAHTYHSMVTGYAAIGGKYIEVTELWGEMKSQAHATGMKFDEELLDSVLYTFVRGGFFSRANEVVEMMERGKMFVDKYKFRTLFLKYHKTMCKGKASKVQTESQLRKREAALSFKKWVGLF
uniref:Pentatricopeptide repeat-containing protein n=1 Tax=Kalanchoe fedtschenkoi TaxID=63787 RepID=A0A7N0R8K6_KALFE